MRERPTRTSFVLWIVGSTLGFPAVVFVAQWCLATNIPPQPTFGLFGFLWMAVWGAITGYAMPWHILAEEHEMEQEENDRRIKELSSN